MEEECVRLGVWKLNFVVILKPERESEVQMFKLKIGSASYIIVWNTPTVMGHGA